MEKTITTGPLQATLHAGCDGERVTLTLAVTNISDEPIKRGSAMGSWASINLMDKNNQLRLESMGSIAAVTSWTIPPGKSLVYQRSTSNPSEISDGWGDSEEVSYIKDSNEYQERIEEDNTFFVPNLNLPKESDETFEAVGSIKLSGLENEVIFTFSPDELNEPIEPSEIYDIEENPKPDFSHSWSRENSTESTNAYRYKMKEEEEDDI